MPSICHGSRSYSQRTDESGLPRTVDGVRERLSASYDALTAALNGAQNDAMLHKDANGVSVKNLLAHIATWQNSLVAALNQQPHYTGLGISEAQARELGTDTINAFLDVRIEAMSLQEAQSHYSRIRHEALQEGLEEHHRCRPSATA